MPGSARRGDPEAIVDVVLALQSDDAARIAMAEQGHELFERRFSIEAISRDVAAIVEELLGELR